MGRCSNACSCNTQQARLQLQQECLQLQQECLQLRQECLQLQQGCLQLQQGTDASAHLQTLWGCRPPSAAATCRARTPVAARTFWHPSGRR